MPQRSNSVIFGGAGVLDQEISIASDVDRTVVTLESAGGGRNPDYDRALEEILRRSGIAGWELSEICLVSREVDVLPREQRLIRPAQVIDLANPGLARKVIQRAVAQAHRRPGASGSGNRQKRIELVFRAPTPDADMSTDLAISPNQTSQPPPSYEVDVNIEVVDGKPRIPEPKALEKAWQLHNQTQMLLVERIKENSLTMPVYVEGAKVDVAWSTEGLPGITIAEVKSLSDRNEDTQLRTAIGEVLYFCAIAREVYPVVRPVVFVPWEPRKYEQYAAACRIGDIEIAWPTKWPSTTN